MQPQPVSPPFLQHALAAGNLPPSWVGLKHLADMRLPNCSLYGSLPPSWGGMSKLQVLYLWGNQLSGQLPGAWSGMKALDDLDLSSNADLTGGRQITTANDLQPSVVDGTLARHGRLLMPGMSLNGHTA